MRPKGRFLGTVTQKLSESHTPLTIEFIEQKIGQDTMSPGQLQVL